MNPFLAYQPPPFGATAQEPQLCRTMLPWSNETLTPYEEPTENCSAGPSSQRQNVKLVYDHKSNSRARKRKREADHNNNTDSDESGAQNKNSGHKPKKRKKRRKS